MDDTKLVAEFNKNAGGFFSSTNIQRDEIYAAYEYRDGHQWNAEKLAERTRLDKQSTTINLAGALVRAVSGTECMQDSKLDFVPVDPMFEEETDIMDDGVSYAQYVSGYKTERSVAREDVITCGLGGTVTYLDMTRRNAIAGTPIVERIFPGFIGFDNSCRGSRVNEKARWCFYADPVSNATLDEYVEQKVEALKGDPVSGAGDYKAFLMSFSRQENVAQIDFIYHYFWWEFDDIIDVANPFLAPQDGEQPHDLVPLMMQDPEVANLMGEAAEAIKIDWEAGYWSLDKDSFKKLQDTLETVSLLTGQELPKLETSKRKGKCYYRAEFARGLLLGKSRSYTQSGHMLNLLTGYFDESLGIFYGMMRPMSYVQDNINSSISDFMDYAESAASGGPAYIKGAGEGLERVIKEKAYKNKLTPVPANTEITPKSLPSTPDAQVNFIRLMIELMPRTLGLGQEFLGIVTSGDMTDSLYGKVMKQSYAVLANFANNSAGADRRQGEIFIDIIRLMADANDGMILPILSPGHAEDKYFRLRKQNIASEYAVRIIDRPISADERQETFNALSQLAPQFQQAGINIMPMIAKLANIDWEDKQELIKLSTPQPSPPDPVNQALLTSQARLQNAQAGRLEMETQEKGATLKMLPEEKQSVIDKNNASAIKTLGDSSIKPDQAAQGLSEYERMQLENETRKIDLQEMQLEHEIEQSSMMQQRAPQPQQGAA